MSSNRLEDAMVPSDIVLTTALLAFLIVLAVVIYRHITK
jgi:hypothetical protein